MSALRLVKIVGMLILFVLHLRHFWGIVFHADHRMVHVGGVVRFLILAWVLQAIIRRMDRSATVTSASAMGRASGHG